MTEITLRFKYIEDEVVKTTQKFFFQGIRKIPIIIYVFGLAAGIYYLLYLNNVYSGIFFISICLTLVVVTMIRYYVFPARKFRNNPQFLEEVTVTFNEDGIQAKHGESHELKQKWDFYNKVIENENGYYLFVKGTKEFIFIPKRVFENKDQEQQFRDLLNNKISTEFKKI